MSSEGIPAGRGPLDEPDVHRAEVIDPAEKLVAQMGDAEGAVADLEQRIERDPNDKEALRQLTLIKERTGEILRRAEEIRKKTVH